MNPRLRASVRAPMTAGFLGVLILAALAGVFLRRETPAPPPVPEGAWMALDDMRIALRALESPDAGQRAFGFDIRGAGLLPIRLAIANQGSSVARIDAPQTFLIDRRGLAWPLLTLDQATARLKTAGGIGQARESDARPWTRAPETLTGFALDVVPRNGTDPAGTQSGGLGAWFGLGGGAPLPLETRVRNDLMGRFPRNPNLTPGQTADGYLLFPGQTGEAQGILSIRLGVALDGRVRVLEIPADKL